jgi:uncharacterized coiled-coil DUF342 family protein
MQIPPANKSRCSHPLGGWCEACLVRPSDPAREAVAADKDAAKLAKAADEARAKYDQADAEWVDAIRAARAAELETQRTPVAIGLESGRLLTGIDDLPGRARKIRRLEEKASELRAQRDGAWARFIAARDAHARAAGRARRQYEQLEAIAAAVKR